MVERIEGQKAATRKSPKPANDNGLEVIEDWPEIIPVTENELRLHETHLADIIAEIVAANDNDP